MSAKLIFLIFPIFLWGIDYSKFYNSVTWRSLLEYDNDFKIKDKNFYLSKNERPNLKDEFFSALNQFKNNPKTQCKFPARKFFLEKELNITFPKVQCDALEEYKTKATPKNLYLVFASENIKNPSSMMGHSFFKIETNKNRNYAITFFTVINTFNPLKLLYENVYGGMRGIFSLQPYNEVLYNYLSKENRNVWEFKLKLTNYQKMLIFYHFWELKDIKLSYFFTKFNCADVVFYNLSLANPKIYNQKKLFITPIDTILLAQKYNLISQKNFIPSDDYFMKMLESKIENNRVRFIKMIVDKNLEIPYLNYYEYYLLSNYAYFQYLKNKISVKRYKYIRNTVDKNTQSFRLDISKYKSPLKLPKPRKIILAKKEDYLKLAFLPSANFLTDNNLEYMGESELKLFYLSLLFKKDKVKLDEFSVYSMYSLVPYDQIIKPFSYKFEISLKNNYFNKNQNNFLIDGGVGITIQPVNDIYTYLLFNGGIAINKQFKGFIYPEIGMTINEIFNMKSVIKFNYYIISDNEKLTTFEFHQSKFINKNLKIYGLFTFKNQTREFEFGIQKSF
jgi:hypothetical protein